VVRAQRIYNNSKWPNPITIKLENILPSLEPPSVETKRPEVLENKTIFNGHIAKMGDVVSLKVCFEYRPYAGFVENLYSSSWERTMVQEEKKEGYFTIDFEGLKNGVQYEVRAVIIHSRMTVYGDIVRFSMK
jgi:alpha-L-fucosidase